MTGTVFDADFLQSAFTRVSTASDPSDPNDGFDSTLENYGNTPLGDYKGDGVGFRYREDYSNDDVNLDTGEAFTWDGRDTGTQDGSVADEDWSQLDQFMRFEADITLDDDSVVSTNVNIMVDTDGNQVMVLPDGAVDSINTNGFKIQSIELGNYFGYGTRNFDASEIANQENYSNEFTDRSPIVCFTSGAFIVTPDGNVKVNDLKVGDLVLTHDSGPQPIKFIYRRRVRALGKHRPVVFERRAIGNTRRWRVSQQHRIHTSAVPAVTAPESQDHLIAALDLVNGSSIRIDTSLQDVEYFHIMFDRHELIWSDGVLSESWHPKMKVANRDKNLRAELESVFPEFFETDRDRLLARQSVTPVRDGGKWKLAITGRARD